MAFVGMTARFEAHMNELYSKYNIAGPGKVGLPYSEIKPNDPARFDLAHDSQFSPNEADSRYAKRLKAFLKTPRGQQFMVNQAELQTGNVFSETRIYNPLFPIGRVPYTTFRITRPLGTARGVSPTGNIPGSTSAFSKDFVNTGFVRGFTSGLLGTTVIGDTSDISPGADFMVGGAGRLQNETSKAAVNKVLLRNGPTGLLNLLPPNNLTRTVGAIKNILQTGILGVNQRPELNVDGEYFSIAQWTGFKRTRSYANEFTQAGVAARKGNVVGAVNSILKGISNAVQNSVQPSKGLPVPTAARDGRDDPNRLDLDGLRYFIVNKNQADRYLQDSIHNGYPSVSYLDHYPYSLSGTAVDPKISNINSSGKSLSNTIKQTKQSSFISKVGGFVKSATSILVGSNDVNVSNVYIGPTDPVTGRLTTGALTNNSSARNPAEERMLFGTLSLASRYEDANGNMARSISETTKQKETWLESIRKLRTEASYQIGYVGGIPIGNPIVDDDGIFALKRVKANDGRYFSDGAISLDAILVNKDTGENTRTINPDLKTDIRSNYNDTIDFIFHDYVNNRVVPFRAILTQLVENVLTDYDVQRYIGRSERNIVYAGAGRELSFTFLVQAMSKPELDFIWQKINYLTGLMFPSNYTDGFMVPPFVQLTLGNLYVDQPGYIRAITNTIEENISWDIDVDAQMPMGVTINVAYVVIEKSQLRTGSSFYGYGTPRPVDAATETIQTGTTSTFTRSGDNILLTSNEGVV